jgi:superfamily II DNA or RNA helicase
MCTEVEWYNRQCEKIDRAKSLYFETRNPNDETRWMMAALARKNFLSGVKTKYARILIRRLQNRRLITFCGSIAQAESLGAKLALHSKLSKEKREKVLTEYLSGTTNNIFVKGMLKEGINIPGIEVGIIIQLDNNSLYFNQLLGRTLRSLLPEQYVLYIKNSQDEKYVETSLDGFNKDYVKFIDFKNF